LIEGKVEEIRPEVITSVERATETILLAEDEKRYGNSQRKCLRNTGTR